MLIEGENAMVFVPNDYGFTVLVGHVAQEMPRGWIVDPCRELLDTSEANRLVEIAAGDKGLRGQCEFGPPIKGGFRAPLSCCSIQWHGKLPN